MTEIKTIYILHEYGAKSHYRALTESDSYNVMFYEFALVKLIIKSIYYRDFKLFLKQFKNSFFILSLIFSKDKKIILGMAPFDVRIILFSLILAKHKVIYHSSWPDWQYKVPKKYFFNFIKILWKRFLLKCEKVACVTHSVKKSIKQFSGIVDSKLVVVSHTLPSYFTSNELIKEPQPDNTINCLFVGRVEKSKGIDLIITLAKINPNINFYIIGENRGRYKFNQSSNINFLGIISDKSELKKMYLFADFLLLPSIKGNRWQELFGLVVIESMALGCIPICTDNVGPKSILDEKFDQLVITESNYVEDTTMLINQLMANSEKRKLLIEDLFIESKKYYSTEIEKIWNL
jgi:glycosyltransferase involved in cell wall biosynthesis